MKKEDLVGVWRERGREIVHADGSVKKDVPRLSQIMYTPDGYMAVCNAPVERKPVQETVARMDLDATSTEERADAAIGVVAYAGTYEVKGEEVHHTLFTALNPNRIGATQVRHVTLSGDDLTLAAPARCAGKFVPHPLAQGLGGPLLWPRARRGFPIVICFFATQHPQTPRTISIKL